MTASKSAQAQQKVAPAWLGGRWFRGSDYLVEMAIPNFFFHATTAYDILRWKGLQIGKRDFIGALTLHDR